MKSIGSGNGKSKLSRRCGLLPDEHSFISLYKDKDSGKQVWPGIGHHCSVNESQMRLNCYVKSLYSCCVFDI